jgi:hypothetical protein
MFKVELKKRNLRYAIKFKDHNPLSGRVLQGLRIFKTLFGFIIKKKRFLEAFSSILSSTFLAKYMIFDQLLSMVKTTRMLRCRL